MNNKLKSSPFGLNQLTQKSSNFQENNLSVNFSENIFSEKTNESQKTKQKIKIKKNNSKKRLNDLDENIFKNFATLDKEKANFFQKINFLFKNNNEQKGFNGFKEIILFLFPIIDKYKYFRECTKKLKKLNDSTTILISEKIPFGESQERYKKLSNKLTLACKLQAKLRKKMN